MNHIRPLYHLRGANTDAIDLPTGINLDAVSFRRDKANLVLAAPEGTTVIIRDFFTVESPPRLRSADGESVTGDLARILVGLSDRAVCVLMSRNRERHSPCGAL